MRSLMLAALGFKVEPLKLHAVVVGLWTVHAVNPNEIIDAAADNAASRALIDSHVEPALLWNLPNLNVVRKREVFWIARILDPQLTRRLMVLDVGITLRNLRHGPAAIVGLPSMPRSVVRSR